MWTVIVEQPILTSIVLALLGITLLFIWTRGVPKAVAVVGGICLLLIPLEFLVAGYVETEPEQIRSMIRQVAERVEENDFQAVYDVIDPQRPEVIARAKAELPNYEFSRAKVGSFRRLVILPGTDPPEAVVDLTASVTVSLSRGGINDQIVARRVYFKLKKSPSGWKVTDYAHFPVIGDRDPYSYRGNTDWEKLLQTPSN